MMCDEIDSYKVVVDFSLGEMKVDVQFWVYCVGVLELMFVYSLSEPNVYVAEL